MHRINFDNVDIVINGDVIVECSEGTVLKGNTYCRLSPRNHNNDKNIPEGVKPVSAGDKIFLDCLQGFTATDFSCVVWISPIPVMKMFRITVDEKSTVRLSRFNLRNVVVNVSGTSFLAFKECTVTSNLTVEDCKGCSTFEADLQNRVRYFHTHVSDQSYVRINDADTSLITANSGSTCIVESTRHMAYNTSKSCLVMCCGKMFVAQNDVSNGSFSFLEN